MSRVVKIALGVAVLMACAVPLPPGARYDGGRDGDDVPEVLDVRDERLDAPGDREVDADVADVRDADATDALDADVLDADVIDVIDVVDADRPVDVPPCDGGCTGAQRCCDGACVDTQTSLLHCGACGNACSTSHATPSCNTGRCFVACDVGWGNCDGDAANGCEVNLNTTPAHCGACGNACPLPPHATSAGCVSGRCGVGVCASGYGDCDGNGANGCETELRATDAHCGRCGNDCGAGRYCSAGACIEQRSCRVPGTPGCGIVDVAGGTFTMGAVVACGSLSHPTCARGATPPHSALVGSFAMDAYEVTVARFRSFWATRSADLAQIRATAVRYPGGRSLAWTSPAQPPIETATSGSLVTCNWSPTASVREAHPMNCLDWWLSQEFCVWDGGRLPTEAEWEYAARGRAVMGLVAGRLYPWGDEEPMRSPCDRAQYACSGEDGTGTRRVGSFAASAGLFDLAGNISEWTADDHAAYDTTPCWMGTSFTNPLCEVSTTADRAIRGGSWYNNAFIGELRSASRYAISETARDRVLGFRCVRTR